MKYNTISSFLCFKFRLNHRQMLLYFYHHMLELANFAFYETKS